MVIRTAQTEDAQQIADIYRPYVEKTAISFEYEAPDKEEMGRRIEATLKNYPYLVAEENGKIVGYAYTGKYKERKAYDRAAEISIYISEGNKRKGTGKKLYQAIEKITRMQNITNLYACITQERDEEPGRRSESAAFHEKMGYRHIGTFEYSGYKAGKWHNTIFMVKMTGDHLQDPPEAIPFSKIEKDKLAQAGIGTE